jgi:hypothetical protein
LGNIFEVITKKKKTSISSREKEISGLSRVPRKMSCGLSRVDGKTFKYYENPYRENYYPRDGKLTITLEMESLHIITM